MLRNDASFAGFGMGERYLRSRRRCAFRAWRRHSDLVRRCEADARSPCCAVQHAAVQQRNFASAGNLGRTRRDGVLDKLALTSLSGDKLRPVLLIIFVRKPKCFAEPRKAGLSSGLTERAHPSASQFHSFTGLLRILAQRDRFRACTQI